MRTRVGNRFGSDGRRRVAAELRIRRARRGKPSRASQFVTPASGLSTVQVAERVAAGRTNATDQRTSRTLAEILKANVFTVFNACW